MSAPVPREFLGQARLFRNRVAAADERIRAVVPVITAQLQKYVGGMWKPKLAIADITDALTAWQSVMDDGLALDGRLRTHRRSFMVAQLRPTCDRITAAAWEGDASGQVAIDLSWHVLQMRGRKAEFTVTPIVTMALHALARRFERGAARDDDSVIRDLAPPATFAAADAKATEPLPAPREVPVTRGRWVGERCVAHDDGTGRNLAILRIATFLNDDQEFIK